MTKVLPPTFDVGNDASQWLIFVGATTTTPLGQVKLFNWTDTISSNETVRVSDSATYYTAVARAVNGPLELWQDNDNAEMAAVGGVTLSVDDTPKTLIAQFHSGEATPSTLVKTYTFANFRITSIEAGPREGQSETYWAYEWRADSVTAS